ncbi:DUF421 domain-containing protein [Flavobacterium sp. ASW18X]|uniref:DUF421 domain-containing protein n=1 Tax=Flavobacterium sp. ASW18X TaxID=2572595 RepID=UPI0010AED269|nr:YetF domain-containing protein [Flavobacterium sp. ASW18X]TKD62514.1 DUF421 domain-containing protein [Flavobacterium sp. ASW18X]
MLEKLLKTTWESALLILLTSIGIYLVTILLTRVVGKRSFSKMSSFDFAMTIAIGSVIATTILPLKVNLAEGFIGLLAIYVLQITLAHFRELPLIQNLVDNKPLLLMDGTNIIYQNLKKAKVTESDLKAKLREANVTHLNQVKAVIFESTGDVSVLHKKDDNLIQNWIIDGVQQ